MWRPIFQGKGIIRRRVSERGPRSQPPSIDPAALSCASIACWTGACVLRGGWQIGPWVWCLNPAGRSGVSGVPDPAKVSELGARGFAEIECMTWSLPLGVHHTSARVSLTVHTAYTRSSRERFDRSTCGLDGLVDRSIRFDRRDRRRPRLPTHHHLSLTHHHTPHPTPQRTTQRNHQRASQP